MRFRRYFFEFQNEKVPKAKFGMDCYQAHSASSRLELTSDWSQLVLFHSSSVRTSIKNGAPASTRQWHAKQCTKAFAGGLLNCCGSKWSNFSNRAERNCLKGLEKDHFVMSKGALWKHAKTHDDRSWSPGRAYQVLNVFLKHILDS